MRVGNGREEAVLWGRGGGQWRGLMLSVRLCLSSALGVLHRSFHGKCTGTDYRRLERERASEWEREKGWRGGRVWFCSQKMSSRVSRLQIPDYAHPYNCFTLSTDLFTLFIYSDIQQVSLFPLSIHQNHFSDCALQTPKSFLRLNKQSNFSTHTIQTTDTGSFGFCSCTINKLVCNGTLSLCPNHPSLTVSQVLSQEDKFTEAQPRSATEHDIVLCVVLRLRSHMASSGGSHFVAFPCICWSLWILPAFYRESCSMKDETTAGHRVRQDAFAPQGRQQLESSGGLNLAKGPEEAIQLFGGKGRDDLSLRGHSQLVSQITT